MKKVSNGLCATISVLVAASCYSSQSFASEEVSSLANEEVEVLAVEISEDTDVLASADEVVSDAALPDGEALAITTEEGNGNDEGSSVEQSDAADLNPDEEFEMSGLLDGEALEENRGTSNASSVNYFFANSSGNTANNTVSGSNNIADSAFSNAAGISSVIQNSGNNVLIQSSTTVNAVFQ